VPCQDRCARETTTGKTSNVRACLRKNRGVVSVDRDRYGRTVGQVFAEAENINEKMMRLGYVWVYRKYAKTRSSSGTNERHLKRGGTLARSETGTAWVPPSAGPGCLKRGVRYRALSPLCRPSEDHRRHRRPRRDRLATMISQARRSFRSSGETVTARRR